MSDPQNQVGAVTAAAVTVNEPGAGNRLAGPGTGRAVSQPADARVERPTSFDPADFPALTGREEDWRFTPLTRLGGAGAPVDRASALAWAGFTEATVITVPQEAEVAEPVWATLTGAGGTA